MKPLTEKILKSGLVDKHMAELMEKYGILEEGSAEKVNEDALKNATREQLIKLSDELSDEVDRSDILRETALDLEKLRWPASVSIFKSSPFDVISITNPSVAIRKVVATNVDAVMDRAGRYYFRRQDVQQDWFIPGYIFERQALNGPSNDRQTEEVLESQPLCIGEEVVCYQVTTRKLG